MKDYEVDPSPEFIERFIRAMQPWPAAWSEIALEKGLKRRMKIIHAHIEEGKLVLDTVQLEGKNEVSWLDFTRGYPKAKFE